MCRSTMTLTMRAEKMSSSKSTKYSLSAIAHNRIGWKQQQRKSAQKRWTKLTQNEMKCSLASLSVFRPMPSYIKRRDERINKNTMSDLWLIITRLFINKRQKVKRRKHSLSVQTALWNWHTHTLNRIDQPVSFFLALCTHNAMRSYYCQMFDVTKKYDCQYLPLNSLFDTNKIWTKDSVFFSLAGAIAPSSSYYRTICTVTRSIYMFHSNMYASNGYEIEEVS